MGAYVSLHGRALGFDSETGALFRNGVEGIYGDQTVTAASTASNITPRGLTTLATTAVKAYTLDAPIVGLVKRLTATGASTSSRTVTVASGTIGTTAGSTGTTLTFLATGQTVNLQALTTALWQVIGNVGAVACT